jgi:hypothetical protein
MFGAIILLLTASVIVFVITRRIGARYPNVNVKFLRVLYLYHLLLSVAYYVYVMFNPSDSKAYFNKVVGDFRGDTWFSFYGTSTTFIEFLGYPFIKYLGFTYESMMVIFSVIGYFGFVYFYLLFKESIRFRHKFLGVDLTTLILFLPNLHFWSSSFGKGSIIFFGIALFFYGLFKFPKRLLVILIGGLIIYHVRPHVMLVILVSSTVAFVFSAKGISPFWRVSFLLVSFGAFFFIYQDVLTLVGIDEEEAVTEGFNLTHRAAELSKATSGVDITGYSLPIQVFTFLYRPLFFDAPGMLGIFVSFENIIYLLLTLKFLTSVRSYNFLFTASFLAKSAFISFIMISIALAQIAGNLGLAMRQKSQVMILFLFVVMLFLDREKMREWKQAWAQKVRLAKNVSARKI